ncbi:TetR/AcrR family transcriptional regulator [uncultured Cohaesibacter sp.]|uniref:acrylate utilization transcriptional regulator AcuR n=1 Tax=uncultured Cohaesibacter sp. TaxID=1002546 RepID=UPI00292DF423|nr:TetR/AcrR family transcriptional regulator [uncultured Cohaesibacter sp.]
MTQNSPPEKQNVVKHRGRPRKAPDDQVARKQLIKAGLVYLTERGFSDVSVDEILKASGTTKGTFYHHFKSKADFGQDLIEAYHSYFAAKLMSWFDNDTLSPLHRLRGFIKDAETGMAKHDFRRGCLVGNLGQEMAVLPDAMCSRLIEVLQDWQSRTAACLVLAQQQGEISCELDAAAMAEFFWIGWEGAVLRAKLERKPDPLRRFADGFFTLLSISPHQSQG